MKKILWLIPALAAVLMACDTKMYEDCPQDHRIANWGVVNDTHTFGEYDSIYYIVNPIGNVNDSVYYNGDYTDSYYESDPLRVMLRYTLEDSIQFNLDRLYTTETNPTSIIMIVAEKEDTVKSRQPEMECVLHLRRNDTNSNLYSTGPDSLFKEMLLSGKTLKISATNGKSASESQGSQNYEFTIAAKGFKEAMELADSLTKLQKKVVRQVIKEKSPVKEKKPKEKKK